MVLNPFNEILFELRLIARANEWNTWRWLDMNKRILDLPLLFLPINKLIF